jgi:hypothetical protein
MKLTGEFWETIGPHYVYGYQHPDGSWKYIGKAVGNRVTHHVAEKGYDLEDAFILARNLSSDAIAASVESVFINEYQPTDNLVSGHHKENYIMASLKGLFDDFNAGQRNYHIELAECIVNHADILGSSIGGSTSNNSGFLIFSGLRESTNMDIRVGKSGVNVSLNSNPTSDTKAGREHFDNLVAQVQPMLEGEYELSIVPNGKLGGKIKFDVEDLETALQLWSDFTS